MPNIIEVKNLKKSYEHVHAIKGLSFVMAKGELLSLLGPNGAGKSTTIDILCTLQKQDEGEATVCGLTLGKDDLMIKQKIGVVFQSSLLDSLLTGRENLELRAGLYVKDGSKAKHMAHEAALAVGAMEFIDRPYGKLSGGQRRKIDIARSLLHKPDLLFLDEPTAGLDPLARQSVWEMILQLQKQRNMSILLTTHYMEEAAVSHNIIMLNQGMIAEKGSPRNLKDKYQASTLDEVFLKVSNSFKTGGNL